MKIYIKSAAKECSQQNEDYRFCLTVYCPGYHYRVNQVLAIKRLQSRTLGMNKVVFFAGQMPTNMPKQWTGSSQQNHSEKFRATFCCNFYTQLNYNWQRRSNAAGECAMTWLSWYPVHCEWTTVNCDWLPDRAGTRFTVCVAGSHHSVWCSGPTAAPGSHSSQWSWGSAPDTHRHIHNATQSSQVL